MASDSSSAYVEGLAFLSPLRVALAIAIGASSLSGEEIAPVIAPDTHWDDLSEALPLTIRSSNLAASQVEVTSQEHGPARVGNQSVDDLARAWRHAASLSEERNRPQLVRASASTFVAAGPGSDSAALLQAFGSELDRQGVSLYAPILTARVGSGARHSHYRDWFAYADALDAGTLVAAAFVDVKQAVRVAAAASTSPNDVVHDPVTDDVEVCDGADYRVSFGAEPLAFMAIMDGTLPEQIFVTAINECRVRATRVARLADAVHEAAGSCGLRFAGDVPVHRFADRLVADPLGAAYVAGAELPTCWEARLRSAALQLASPVCMCSEPRRVQAILRTASRLARFADAHPRSWVVAADVGVRHRLAYELRCPHAARLLTAADGWDLGECHRQWLADPLDGQLRTRCVRRFGYAASMIHGEEVGAFAACADLLQPLCTTLGYPVDTQVAVCAAAANVLLVSDEPVEVVAKIIDASRVWAGQVGALADHGLSPGTKVRYLSSIVVRWTESDHPLRNRLLPLGVPSD